ncbi:SDR family NAD(P)-dependent oxidoreductase [Hymenobacter sp. RP-2-7]|uniref:SDR family NAD(P)-dependent oxidoreductase n=1 Tax=Hymenobacter polaris TaxID=2682546 RepID=A0A7Y0AIB7_9BACT|nr:oxidoreductase [Hymenobacter polaris]NML67909.1 SDR family NAD(P)-dependent oxidoreductase [Hymenobacter polaris]
MQRVILLTGASAGMGKVTAKLLAAHGHRVFAAARRVEHMQDLVPLGITPLALDVTDEQSRHHAVEQVLAATGHLDVLINNAGFGRYGAVEDVPLAEARRQFEVNLFGAAQLIQLVLPGMRAQHGGRIINISSIGGKMATPYGGWYHASKFALEGLSDSLRNEVKPFGIEVVVIEPGGVKSEWAGIATGSLLETSASTAYATGARQFARSAEAAEAKGADPAVIARLVLQAVETKQPRTRYVGGYLARPILWLRALLPDRLFDRLITSQLA